MPRTRHSPGSPSGQTNPTATSSSPSNAPAAYTPARLVRRELLERLVRAQHALAQRPRLGRVDGADLERHSMKRPLAWTSSPSAVSVPPARRSQIRSQWTARAFLPPVSGYERPSARWTVPPIFSSNRIVPVGRSMPKFVPMPISPSRRAPSSVASAALQVVVAAVGPRRDDLAVAERQLDAVDVDARGRRRTVKRTVPLALVSIGPVKTSPLTACCACRRS